MSIIPEFFVGDESTYWWRFHGWRDDRKPTSIYRANSKVNLAFYQKLLAAAFVCLSVWVRHLVFSI